MMTKTRKNALLAEMGVKQYRPKSRGKTLAQEQSGGEDQANAPSVAKPAAKAASASTPKAAPKVVKPKDDMTDAALQARREQIMISDLPTLKQQVKDCRACGLCESRKQTVFGVGDEKPEWVIIGEAPGANEDEQGEPFVGQSGKLLDNMLASIGLSRQAGGKGVFILNTLKCRPPDNRNPEPDEMEKCEPFLKRQLELLQPKIIICVGRFAITSLLNTKEAIGSLRAKVHHYAGIPTIVTYHPAYLLRNLADKSKAWEDLCFAKEVAARHIGT